MLLRSTLQNSSIKNDVKQQRQNSLAFSQSKSESVQFITSFRVEQQINRINCESVQQLQMFTSSNK